MNRGRRAESLVCEAVIKPKTAIAPKRASPTKPAPLEMYHSGLGAVTARRIKLKLLGSCAAGANYPAFLNYRP